MQRKKVERKTGSPKDRGAAFINVLFGRYYVEGMIKASSAVWGGFRTQLNVASRLMLSEAILRAESSCSKTV